MQRVAKHKDANLVKGTREPGRGATSRENKRETADSASVAGESNTLMSAASRRRHARARTSHGARGGVGAPARGERGPADRGGGEHGGERASGRGEGRVRRCGGRKGSGGAVCVLGSQPRFKQLHTTSKCPKTRENKFAPRKQTNTRTNSPQLGSLSPPSSPVCSLTLRKARLETL